jgi:ABC-type lipoprotein release transport system permease subunit
LLVKPTSVRALERVTMAPLLLGAVLAGLLVLTCGSVLAMSVRARRVDLAVLRALGADGSQLRRIIHWQATLLAVIVVAVGVPGGVAAGRWVVQLVTGTLGIVPGAEISMTLLLATAVVTIATANLLALLPARGAARTTAGELLRDR